jgi:membrane protein DedA with SNARE-associated domain
MLSRRGCHGLGRPRTFVERFGVLGVFLLPLARTFISLPAGARRVPLLPFVALTALGCALWAVTFISTGLIAGRPGRPSVRPSRAFCL